MASLARLGALVGVLALLAPVAPARGVDAPSADEESALEAAAELGQDLDEEEDEGLRQRLTEREDKRRPPRPWSTDVAGHPLVITGEWEVELDYLRRRILDPDERQRHRLLLQQQLELEAFYSIGAPLALFAQLQLGMEDDLRSNPFEDVSAYFVERGEMWLYSEDIAGTNLNFDIGRLDYEDERRWWWDDELDSVRLAWETESFEVVLALARELLPERSDAHRIDPEHDRVLRWIGEVGWDYHAEHAFELFALHQDDRSPTERTGTIVRGALEDESDARLTWLGARAFGVFDLGAGGILGYWLDTGLVRGEERFLELEEVAPARSLVDDRVRRDVRGSGFDVGMSWLPPLPWEPRLFAGYARGSGDETPDEGTDRAFRQTGLHANEAGFGGVERFNHYGVLLEPELSNLQVLTVGVGFSLLRSSSLDLVYHHYRLLEPAESLREARLEGDLDGVHRRLGHAFDVVLALEEWERLELELVAAAFRAGAALGPAEGDWSFGGLVAVRYAF